MNIYNTESASYASGESLLYEALRRYSIKYPPRGVSKRFTRWGRNNRYWAIACYDGYIFGDFATDLVEKIFPDRKCNHAEIKKRQREISAALREAKRLEAERHMAAARLAFKIWEAASSVTEADYLIRKQVPSYGLRSINSEQLMSVGFDIVSAFSRQFANTDSEFIVIPLLNTDSSISSIQFINHAGKKRFLPGGRKKGCCYTIGEFKNRILLCEGYCTGSSIFQATNEFTVCCFDAGNLSAVAVNIKALYPSAEIIICADNDDFTEDHKGDLYNKGKEEAKKAGNAIGTYVVYPIFKDQKDEPTDFNDLFCREGIDTVRNQIKKVYKEI